MRRRISTDTERKLFAANILFAIPFIVLFSRMDSTMLIVFIVLFGVYPVAILFAETLVEPVTKGTAPRPEPIPPPERRLSLQFDLRDMLLAFVFVGATMGLSGKYGGPIAAYLLLVICLARVLFSWSPLLKYVVLVAGIFFGACLLAPLLSDRGLAHQAACANKFKMVGIALHEYCSKAGQFPMAHQPDDNGTPAHSWRVALLPELEYQREFDQYDYNEAWNGANNSVLSGSMPVQYWCPSGFSAAPITDVVAIVGPGTAWPADHAIGPEDMPDGSSNTIMVAEVANSGIHWMSPRDLTLADLARGIQPQSGLGISSYHASGAHVLFADGSVQFMSNDTSPEVLQALATIDGSEPFNPRQEEEKRRERIASRREARERAAPLTLALMLASGFILTFRPFGKPEQDPATESVENHEAHREHEEGE